MFNEYCEYTTHPEPVYSYWSNKVVEYYFCWMGPKPITALNENDLVFNQKCKAKDLRCSLGDIIIIWKKETIHECPFYNVTDAFLTADEDFETNAILGDKNDQLAFRLVSKLLWYRYVGGV